MAATGGARAPVLPPQDGLMIVDPVEIPEALAAEIDSSHAVMPARPDEVAAFIERAATPGAPTTKPTRN